MKKPKLTLIAGEDATINPDFGKEAYAELKEIKEDGEVGEYGFQLRLVPKYKRLKPGDIILMSYPEVDIYAEVKVCLDFASGTQDVEFKYKDFIFKE